MTVPPFPTDEHVRAYFSPWCSAWFLPVFRDLAAHRSFSRRTEELKSLTQRSMHALSCAWNLPHASAVHRDRLNVELEKLYRLLVARRNGVAIDYQVWQVVYRWHDLATTGDMSDD